MTSTSPHVASEDITFGAYNGSITIGDTSLSETTAAPTDAPAQNTDPTERPRVTDAPAATLSPCERNGHSYGAYETVTPATCSVAGDSVAVCTVCGVRQLSMHQLRLADLDGNGILYAWEIALLLRKGVS